ncbi:MAG: hypothetical protein WBP93_21085 [Pyrinomonadaceae bacterium]
MRGTASQGKWETHAGKPQAFRTASGRAAYVELTLAYEREID